MRHCKHIGKICIPLHCVKERKYANLVICIEHILLYRFCHILIYIYVNIASIPPLRI